jgi:hypothetical protein
VQKTTREEEIERFPRELERRKWGARRVQFPRKIGHISQGKLLCECADIFFVVVGGRTIRIRTVRTTKERGHEFRGKGGTNFEVVLRVFLVVKRVVQIRSYSKLWACFPRCYFLGGSYNSTDLTRFARQIFGGTVWVL